MSAAPTAPRTAATPTSEQSRIYNPLDQLRGTIRRYVIFDGLLAAGLFLLAWFWIGLLLDFGLFKLTGVDWVQDTPRTLRLVVLGIVSLALVVLVFRRVAYQLTKQFSYPSLALVLEKRFPKVLGDKLITAVELADVEQQAKYGYSTDMIQEVITDAREAVGKVPVNSVFNWGRLKRKAVLLVVTPIVLMLASYGLYAASTPNKQPTAFLNQFADVSTIWGERNLFLMNTPWPRRAYLELVEFPEQERRIGRDAEAPTIRAKAYQWVVADRNSRDGWRPMLTSDLNGFGINSAPAVPEGPEPVDAFLARQGAGSELAQQLDELAARPSMSRQLRKLTLPERVSLSYSGIRTAGAMDLTRDTSGEFSGELGGLKESVGFVVKAEDFASARRNITLVPPPQFTSLKRTEYQPAYLYHAPPPDQDFNFLAGKRQRFAEQDLSLTGDRSILAVPSGTEVTFVGTADRLLKQVRLVPKTGTNPEGGKQPYDLELTTVTEELVESNVLGQAEEEAPRPGFFGRLFGKSDKNGGAASEKEVTQFTFAYRGPQQLRSTSEFDLVLTDNDNVTSTRTITIQVAEDSPPRVEVGVDVLRRQGNNYLCTPIALVPFFTESIVDNRIGLSRVEYQFSYTKQEADVVVDLQAQAMAGVWASVPLIPNIGTAISPTVSAAVAMSIARPGRRDTGSLAVSRFQQDFAGLPKYTADALEQILSQPMATEPKEGQIEARQNVVREIRFRDQISDTFDLERALPNLRVRDPNEIQPRYRLELTMRAVDVNFETGPRIGESLEPIRLLIVSEQDLLAEMNKDEDSLITKLDGVINRLKTAQSRLNETADRLVSTEPPPDILVSSGVRSLGVLQDVTKEKDQVQSILGDYRRLRREAEVNRINPATIKRWDDLVIKDLDGVIQGEFPNAEEALNDFQGQLAAGLRPNDSAQALARTNMQALIARLESVRSSLGDAISINKLREDLRAILDRQRQLSQGLKRIQAQIIENLFAPKILPVPAITMAKQEKKTVTHVVDWNVFEDGEFKVKLEAPEASGLKLPAEVVVTDDKDEFDYELTAGDKPGEYTIRLVPSVGEPVMVKVTVK